MRKNAYLQRLRSDLDRWVESNWIDVDLSDRLYADAAQQDFRALRSSPILPGLATLTIALGLLAIIASNWSDFNGVTRLGLYFVLLAAAVFGSGEARSRGNNTVSNMAATIGAVLAGGGLVVIGQLYHTSATTAAFISAWTFLALVTALLLRSPLAAAVSALLSIFWVFAHFNENGIWLWSSNAHTFGPLWALPVLAAITFMAVQARTLSLIHLVFISAMIWITPTLVELLPETRNAASLALLLMALIWLFIAAAFEALARTEKIWAVRTIAGWSAWVFTFYLVAAAAAERFQHIYFGRIGLSIFALAVFSALTAYGSAPGRRWIRGAGVAGFIAVSVIFFTMADNLLLVGLAMILFGAALIALLTVTNKMLRRAAEAETKGAA